MTPPPSSSSTTGPGERIQDVDVSAEMEGSFLEYAYSVIYSRALPDARDGLTPVPRRILFQMSEMGLRPDRGHVKSARVVGDVMGRLHPHGDTAIYDALVRLAQDFTMRVPLVDGHGNFGSLDDGPAAARYTEARMRASAVAMCEGLDEDVVDFVPNYDNQLTQPEVLPAAYPNLLVNGASGIAVGMATNMAPHNLIEVAAAAKHLLENPEAGLDELMAYVPGPDLPTGGTIVGLDGIRDAYATGRGSFKTRAKVTVEQVGPRKTALVVTELPYLVGPEKVIEKIKDGVQAKKITGISDVTDLTDRKNGLRLVIGLKTGFSPEGVLEQLYRLTPLEDGFGINNVCLVGGQPQTLGLRDLLQVYLDHRIQVVTRRSRYRLTRRQERLHLVLGLLIAILDIDEVIQVVRSSDDAAAARVRLMEVFDLSTLQADYILELQLRRLTKFSRIELENERDKLQREIAELEALLGDPARVREQVGIELDEVAERFGTPRRTLLTEAKASIAATPAQRRAAAAGGPALEIADGPTLVVLSTTGRMVRVEGAEITARSGRRGRHDAILSTVPTTVRGELGAVTSRGRLVRFSPVDLPSVPGNSVQLAAGARVGDYLGLADQKERVLGLVSLSSDDPIALATSSGTVHSSVTLNLSAPFTGLLSDTSYHMRVSALNLTGVPTQPAVDLGAALTLPATPYILAEPQTFTGALTDGFTVNWAANNNSSHTVYNVQVSTKSDFSVVSSSLSVRALACSFTDLLIDTTYFVRLQARGQTGILSPFETAWSTKTVLYSQLNAVALQDSVISLQTSYGLISVHIPRGAIGISTRLQLQPVSAFPAPVSAVSALSPTGIGLSITHFPPTLVLDAITITLPYRPADLPGGTDRSKLILALYDEGHGVWVPLPSNSDTANDRVIGQTWHLSTFQIMQATSETGLANVKIYPNPYRPNSVSDVMHFTNLTPYARVKIYTFLGELVRSIRADVNGMAYWDGLNDDGRKAASGVYIAFIQTSDKKGNKSFKVAVER